MIWCGAGIADGGGQGLDPQQVRGAHDAGETPPFLFCDAICYPKMINLPRQARDKHREIASV